MKEEKPKETLPYTCTPAYDRSSCGTVSVQLVMSRNSAIAAAPARNFLTKKTPVDATRAHIAIKKQEMLTE